MEVREIFAICNCFEIILEILDNSIGQTCLNECSNSAVMLLLFLEVLNLCV